MSRLHKNLIIWGFFLFKPSMKRISFIFEFFKFIFEKKQKIFKVKNYKKNMEIDYIHEAPPEYKEYPYR